MAYDFPDGFLWGAATASHQIEGGNVANDWWDREHAPDTGCAEPSGDACDSYHRYGEDIAILGDLGLNAYRFSLEWSRIEPAEGEFSQAALDHYRRVVAACLERGVEPVLTLNHFTVPRWFDRSGGWRAGTAVDRFERFTERALGVVREGVQRVCTLNEPNLLAAVTPIHEGAPFPADFPPAPDQEISAALLAAHARARDVLHTLPGVRAGYTVACFNFHQPAGADPAPRDRAYAAEDWFLEQAAADDFLGVQAYSRIILGTDGVQLPPPDGAEVTQVGWEFYPAALEETVRRAWRLTGGTPILITENGIATADDSRRIAYTEQALAGLAAAMADGVSVEGYLHWSLLDNFEWHQGYRPTFGLVAVDRTTFERTIKPSARRLGAVATANRL